ncbi:MAG: DUF4123 domain-containing protein [Bacteroidota bacterium]
MTSAATSDAVHEALWSYADLHGQDRIYAILDGAQDDRIYANLLLAGIRYECLYRGRLPEALAVAAPYLVELKRETPIARWVLKHGWGRHWGIWLVANESLEGLRHHFRRFLEVRTEQRERLYFRYYDPRVWRAYLPTCTRQELDFVFGPVAYYLVESEEPDEMLTFGQNATGLTRFANPV